MFKSNTKSTEIDLIFVIFFYSLLDCFQKLVLYFVSELADVRLLVR